MTAATVKAPERAPVPFPLLQSKVSPPTGEAVNAREE
jgi:hypothetical protein